MTMTRADLDAAKAALSKFKLIAINEAFDASVGLLATHFNLKLDRASLLGVSASTGTSEAKNLKASTAADLYMGMKGVLAGDAELRALLLERNALDIELYDFARKRFCDLLVGHGLRGVTEDASKHGAANVCGPGSKSLEPAYFSDAELAARPVSEVMQQLARGPDGGRR